MGNSLMEALEERAKAAEVQRGGARGGGEGRGQKRLSTTPRQEKREVHIQTAVSGREKVRRVRLALFKEKCLEKKKKEEGRKDRDVESNETSLRRKKRERTGNKTSHQNGRREGGHFCGGL